MVDPLRAGTDPLLIVRTMASLHGSPVARSLLDQAREARVEIRVAEDIDLDAGVFGKYTWDDRTIWIRRSLLERDPTEATKTLVHELQHAADHTSGRSDQLRAQLERQYAAEGPLPTSGLIDQVDYHLSIASESRAVLRHTQVMAELGFPPRFAVERAIVAAPSELAAYQAVWGSEAVRDNRHMAAPLGNPPVVFMPGNSAENPL